MMKLLKHIMTFFLSLRTTLWLLSFVLVLMFAGAFIMPVQEEFQTIHSTPMFEWLGNQMVGITWWLWGLMGLLFVLSINTLFCSVESIVKKRKTTQWLLLISPQIIHIGFLLVLVAHLLSAAGGYQSMTAVQEGSMLRISDDAVLRIKDINIEADFNGYVTGWEVGVEYLRGGKTLHTDTIAPNSPSTRMGLNVNVKNLQLYPRAVLLQVSREPGAVWALAGGIAFMAGIFALIILKMRLER